MSDLFTKWGFGAKEFGHRVPWVTMVPWWVFSLFFSNTGWAREALPKVLGLSLGLGSKNVIEIGSDWIRALNWDPLISGLGVGAQIRTLFTQLKMRASILGSTYPQLRVCGLISGPKMKLVLSEGPFGTKPFGISPFGTRPSGTRPFGTWPFAWDPNIWDPSVWDPAICMDTAI